MLTFTIMVGFVALGLIAWACSDSFPEEETRPNKRVGVYMPGASYPLGGFKKPTIKNMVKM